MPSSRPRNRPASSANPPLIALEHVNVDLGGARVLHDITWSLEAGRHWAVLGANGAGKSTFLRLLRGEIWPAPVGGGVRRYCLDGTLTESPIGVRLHVALVSAEQQTRYMRTDWQMKCWQVAFTGLFDGDLIYHHPQPEQLEQVRTSMAALEIEALWDADFHKLSQGQLRRVLIARALVRRPRVLICDEIGVGLDRASRHTLLGTVERAAYGGVQILMTSHRREELLDVITDQLELVGGRLSSGKGSGKSSGKSAEIEVRDSEFKVRSAEISARTNTLDSKVQTSNFLLDLQNVTVALDEGATVVLRDVTWRMNEGEHWMLLGDNGAGKTSLLRLIMGDLWPAEGGCIHRFGERGFTDVWKIKRQIGYVSQELQARYHHDITARQVVGTGFTASVGWLSRLEQEQEQRVDEVLAELGLTALAERSLQQMSYGQVRKVLVARALVHRPRLLILDEVFDGLDAHFRAELRTLFERLSATTGILLVSHHDDDTLPCITHRLRIEGGRKTQ
ncbi:MAG: ATP-binding cassette domain-containing protein [Chloroflexi bacterium]|nr:ATP-binding cassette domain-containing protein [Chloroflexota bacterium]